MFKPTGKTQPLYLQPPFVLTSYCINLRASKRQRILYNAVQYTDFTNVLFTCRISGGFKLKAKRNLICACKKSMAFPKPNL
jgi:hypothetical protein